MSECKNNSFLIHYYTHVYFFIHTHVCIYIPPSYTYFASLSVLLTEGVEYCSGVNTLYIIVLENRKSLERVTR